MKQGYWIFDFHERYQRVKGHKICLPGFEHLDLFIHLNPLCDSEKSGYRSFAVSEGQTGRRIGYEGNTVPLALEYAVNSLQNHTNDVQDFIQQHIEKYGVSPRYMENTP